MKFFAVLPAIVFLAVGTARAADPYRQVLKIEPLPKALDPAFTFRKTKLYLLSDLQPKYGAGKGTGLVRDPSVGFERSYHLYGAVTNLDKRSRYGDYLDFFWRAKKDATVTVRLEYRPEALRYDTQAREVTYAHATGNHKTSFAVIGDDYVTDGRILSWRCLLIVEGRIVAENRSYLWSDASRTIRDQAHPRSPEERIISMRLSLENQPSLRLVEDRAKAAARGLTRNPPILYFL